MRFLCVLIWMLVSPAVLALDLLTDRSAIHYLSINDFELTDGLEKLRSLAALTSIDSTVPIFFSLAFSQQ